jgi:hypothetical protein
MADGSLQLYEYPAPIVRLSASWALRASSESEFALSVGAVESLDQSQKSKGTRSNTGR